MDTSSFNEPRQLGQLTAFIKAFNPTKGSDPSKASMEKGTPHTLVVSSAALRAADVVRYAICHAILRDCWIDSMTNRDV